MSSGAAACELVRDELAIADRIGREASEWLMNERLFAYEDALADLQEARAAFDRTGDLASFATFREARAALHAAQAELGPSASASAARSAGLR